MSHGRIDLFPGVWTDRKKLFTFRSMSGSRLRRAWSKILLLKNDYLYVVSELPHHRSWIIGFWKNLARLPLLGLLLKTMYRSLRSSGSLDPALSCLLQHVSSWNIPSSSLKSSCEKLNLVQVKYSSSYLLLYRSLSFTNFLKSLTIFLIDSVAFLAWLGFRDLVSSDGWRTNSGTICYWTLIGSIVLMSSTGTIWCSTLTC